MERILLTAQDVKKLYGLHRNTLLNREKQGLLCPIKTPGGRRRYRKEDIERLPGMFGDELQKDSPKAILYARISTRKQEEYLRNQIERLKRYAEERGWRYEVISEIAGGVNENRRGLQKLLNRVKNGRVERAVVEYPDRLARFGFNYLKTFFESHGVELVVINGEEHEEDRMREPAEDLIAIVTSFAARVYGARGGKKK